MSIRGSNPLFGTAVLLTVTAAHAQLIRPPAGMDLPDDMPIVTHHEIKLDQANSVRPLTFAWNGGPGSPASTVHLALIGPRRAKTMDEY